MKFISDAAAGDVSPTRRQRVALGFNLGNGTGKTDTATVTIAINGLIWFVDSNAATSGDGRLSSPFNCLTGSGCYS